LYSDHLCSRDAFPSLTTNILSEHSDEVWNIAWSHNGEYLASASKDKSAIIWQLRSSTWEIYKVLREHEYPVWALAWSPDDSVLVTGAENYVKIWSTKTGLPAGHIDDKDQHVDQITALAWLPDGSGFLSASMDKMIFLWGADGKKKEVWAIATLRIADLALAPDLSRLVVVGIEVRDTGSNSSGGAQESNTSPAGASSSQHPQVSEHKMVIYDFATKTTQESMVLDGELTSVKISEDSQYALLNHAPDEVQLWDLEKGRMTRKFTGQRQGRHIIRSCFGGVDSNFILSGSEDKNVYVWHRETGSLLCVLAGHGNGSVNAIAWNPKNKRMFASCSDDHDVRIWEPAPPEMAGMAVADSEAAPPSAAAEQNGKGKGRS